MILSLVLPLLLGNCFHILLKFNTEVLGVPRLCQPLCACSSRIIERIMLEAARYCSCSSFHEVQGKWNGKGKRSRFLLRQAGSSRPGFESI
jgi:hypothetical protein